MKSVRARLNIQSLDAPVGANFRLILERAVLSTLCAASRPSRSERAHHVRADPTRRQDDARPI